MDIPINGRQETPYKAQVKRSILAYIHNYRVWSGGISPSISEIETKIGISGIQQAYIDELVSDGWLKRKRRVARSLTLVHPVDVLYPLPEADNASA